MNRELAAKEERRRRLRNLLRSAAITLRGTGCCLLYAAWSLTQAPPPPLDTRWAGRCT
jgi:hypothetical protein